MDYEEYYQRQKEITLSLTRILFLLLKPFQYVLLTQRMWVRLMAEMYPYVDQARRESAALAREFYDSERRKHVGNDDFDIDLAPYEPAWFEEALQPVKQSFMKRDTSDDDFANVLQFVVKQVENAGRRTQLWAVEDDPMVKGWARVQGGEDSCAFCAMLISRGPVYDRDNPRSAGLKLSKSSAVELWRQIDAGNQEAENAYDAMMTRWHPNCDCKVVPVFDKQDWPGRDSFLEAQEIWRRETRGYSGREKFNAFRRYIESQAREESLDFNTDNVIELPIAS